MDEKIDLSLPSSDLGAWDSSGSCAAVGPDVACATRFNSNGSHLQHSQTESWAEYNLVVQEFQSRRPLARCPQSVIGFEETLSSQHVLNIVRIDLVGGSLVHIYRGTRGRCGAQTLQSNQVSLVDCGIRESSTLEVIKT